MPNDTGVTRGSGNVFGDLGLPNPEERSLKASLAAQINTIIERRKLTQREAARALGIAQPDMSDLQRGRLKRFSVERLLRFLTRLDQEVSIIVRPLRGHRRKSVTEISARL